MKGRLLLSVINTVSGGLNAFFYRLNTASAGIHAGFFVIVLLILCWVIVSTLVVFRLLIMRILDPTQYLESRDTASTASLRL